MREEKRVENIKKDRARRTKEEVMEHSERSGGHLKKHKGRQFNREKKKMKKGNVRLGQIDTSVKSIKFDD
ncbi:hypothetical protein NEFER03_0016 [Nematocida sp. LUAm3]|nr:hypothetical protein NEFER03_0016 [Nematocida sp. LUAm3]KAI5173498.1 hypothetical protein NEFER02_0014 [Nematocida sp. LUAm2]KAI5176691.1 hypothetical protein NEFER01_0016 [Nematocida sp. LUAm1]